MVNLHASGLGQAGPEEEAADGRSPHRTRARAAGALPAGDDARSAREDALEAAWSRRAARATPDPEAQRFALELVEGRATHRDEIDALIEQHSHNWRLDRMSRDRSQRAAAGRLRAEVPPGHPARRSPSTRRWSWGRTSAPRSPRAFINGLLDRIAVALTSSDERCGHHDVPRPWTRSTAAGGRAVPLRGRGRAAAAGRAGFVDWRLCGSLSRVLMRRLLHGRARGARCCCPRTDECGALARILAVGLGGAGALSRECWEGAVQRRRSAEPAKVESVALELPGGGGWTSGAGAQRPPSDEAFSPGVQEGSCASRSLARWRRCGPPRSQFAARAREPARLGDLVRAAWASRF